jgi:catechol 2,3-dioxygenase-like lactoylglutathione lyase family enzyme
MNHFAISTASQEDVDATGAYLRERGVELLFDTPRHRPEFSASEDSTYYQIMFETPDRLLVEVVYIGTLRT